MRTMPNTEIKLLLQRQQYIFSDLVTNVTHTQQLEDMYLYFFYKKS